MELDITKDKSLLNTLVIGASTNPERYAYKATTMLKAHGYQAIPFGLKSGSIEGIDILTHPLQITEDIDTVTLYVGPRHQSGYFDLIISLNPRRVIFNPGTENSELYSILKKHDIEIVIACTLVMLSTGQY